MSTLIIRKARPGDIHIIYELFSEADRLHRDAYPEIFRETDSVSKIKDYYLSCIKNPDAIIFVAQQQNNVIGALISTLHTSRRRMIKDLV